MNKRVYTILYRRTYHLEVFKLICLSINIPDKIGKRIEDNMRYISTSAPSAWNQYSEIKSKLEQSGFK